jgi:hypothetical protein
VVTRSSVSGEFKRTKLEADHSHYMSNVIDVTHGDNFNYFNHFYPNTYISFFRVIFKDEAQNALFKDPVRTAQ